MKSLSPVLLILFLLLSFKSFTQDNTKHFFVFLNRNPNRVTLPEEEAKKLQEGHMNNINRLAEEGKLLAAGPFEDGGGIFIFLEHKKDNKIPYEDQSI